MARELAVAQKVCVRPIMRRVIDRDTDTDQRVAIPCGSTRESVCPSCAHKARILRMQQCAEGWHRTEEPEQDSATATATRPDDLLEEGEPGPDPVRGEDSQDRARRARSTRRRDDVCELPRVTPSSTTVGAVYSAPNGREYRPSMFLTMTLPSYGAVGSGGIPLDPDRYDYRRAALDALHFAKLVDRFWQNLRRCAGFKVQYFATVEPQARLAAHLHAAVRGAIPRQLLRQVIRATYVQVWWPSFDRAVYVDRLPVWDGEEYVDPDTGAALPTWDEALAQVDADPDARPVHVARFGKQADMRGIIAPSADAERAVRYLTKYLTKAVADPISDDADEWDPAREAHIDRLHTELRYLPCSPQCANWLRYGLQPKSPGAGLAPGRCPAKAHDREHLGLGGRRVLVSRQWSGKTLAGHRADRATVVRQALLTAGVLAPDVERLAADTLSADGHPRFVWTDTKTDPISYSRVILESIAERQRWRTQYEQAKAAGGSVDDRSATAQPP
ncbi:replication initiator [Auraticoccus monumenti]